MRVWAQSFSLASGLCNTPTSTFRHTLSLNTQASALRRGAERSTSTCHLRNVDGAATEAQCGVREERERVQVERRVQRLTQAPLPRCARNGRGAQARAARDRCASLEGVREGAEDRLRVESRHVHRQLVAGAAVVRARNESGDGTREHGERGVSMSGDEELEKPLHGCTPRRSVRCEGGARRRVAEPGRERQSGVANTATLRSGEHALHHALQRGWATGYLLGACGTVVQSELVIEQCNACKDEGL